MEGYAGRRRPCLSRKQQRRRLKENPLNLDVEDLEYIKTFDHVHTTNNSYFDEQLPKLAEQGISVSYDFSGQWVDEDE